MNYKLRLILNFDYKKISGKGVKYRSLLASSYQTTIRPPKELELGCITLSVDGMLDLDKDYEWNGGNFIFDSPSVMRGSKNHDAACELYAEGWLEKSDIKKFNDMFEDICKEDGAPRWRYKIHRFFLKKGWQGIFS